MLYNRTVKTTLFLVQAWQYNNKKNSKKYLKLLRSVFNVKPHIIPSIL